MYFSVVLVVCPYYSRIHCVVFSNRKKEEEEKMKLINTMPFTIDIIKLNAKKKEQQTLMILILILENTILFLDIYISIYIAYIIHSFCFILFTLWTRFSNENQYVYACCWFILYIIFFPPILLFLSVAFTNSIGTFRNVNTHTHTYTHFTYVRVKRMLNTSSITLKTNKMSIWIWIDIKSNEFDFLAK